MFYPVASSERAVINTGVDTRLVDGQDFAVAVENIAASGVEKGSVLHRLGGLQFPIVAIDNLHLLPRAISTITTEVMRIRTILTRRSNIK